LHVGGNVYAEGRIISGPGNIWLDGSTDSVVTDGNSMELLVNTTERVLRLESSPISPNVIGGHQDNTVGLMGAVHGATISGGGDMFPLHNEVTVDFGTVGGGCWNVTNGWAATIGGG
jgi:hypothetical protein